jgi:penicillin amidase
MRIRSKLTAAVACALGVLGFLTTAPPPAAAAALPGKSPAAARMPAAQSAARLIQDRNGITYIRAGSLRDLFFLQGWVHARDRLFQMDVSRREPGGTLAELLGKAALPGDVQARTIGLRRAAERSWAAAPPDLRAAVTAYSDGVNAYVASHPLPPEYAALHLGSFRPWTPVDTLTVGKAIAFELSFDLDIAPTLQLGAYVAALGPQRGFALFSQDVMRSQPFSDASTIPGCLPGLPRPICGCCRRPRRWPAATSPESLATRCSHRRSAATAARVQMSGRWPAATP